MEKCVLLFALALCSVAMAQEDMVMSSGVEPTVVPTASPLPPETVKNETYTLNDTTNTSNVCLRMTIGIGVNITYINSTGQNQSMAILFTNTAELDKSDSFCNASATNGSLTLFYTSQDGYKMFINFLFKGDNTSGSQHWSLGDMTLAMEAAFLPDYNHTDLLAPLEFNTTDKLHQDTNEKIEFTRSYVCNTDQALNFSSAVYDVNPIVLISQLQVQAFHFENSTTGDYDNPRTCLLDSAGKANKIVPIAVGAALAGLVVVVLVAYLIGRLRSRRQSSYEALS